jgi:hypothetical protein
VPFIKYCDTITKEEVLEIIQGRSAFAQKPISLPGNEETAKQDELDSRMEGIYIRFDDPKRLICEARGKIVRSDFLGVDAKHWTRAKPVWNRTKSEVGESQIKDEIDWNNETMINSGTLEAGGE